MSTPKTSSRLMEAIGLNGIRMLAKRYPGIRLSVPTKCAGLNYTLLQDFVGDEIAKKLIDNFGGESVWVPRGTHLQLLQRDRKIIDEIRGGKKINDIALDYGMTDRQVYNICKKMCHDETVQQLQLI